MHNLEYNIYTTLEAPEMKIKYRKVYRFSVYPRVKICLDCSVRCGRVNILLVYYSKLLSYEYHVWPGCRGEGGRGEGEGSGFFSLLDCSTQGRRGRGCTYVYTLYRFHILYVLKCVS